MRSSIVNMSYPPSHPPYSPTRPTFFHEPYNNNPQNYQSNPLFPQSPRRPNLGSPLPPPSATIPQHVVAPAPPYQPMTSSPTYQTQRPFSSHHHHQPIMSSTPYEPPSSVHGHPSSRQGSSHHSPGREYTPLTNGVNRDPPPSEPRPQSQGVSG